MADYPVTITAEDALSNIATKNVTFAVRALGFHPDLLSGYALASADYSTINNNGLVAPSAYRTARASRVLTGKRYVECMVNGTGSGAQDAFGLLEESSSGTTWIGAQASSCGLYTNGATVYKGGSVIATGTPTSPAARRVKMAFDASNGYLWLGFTGGGWVGGGDPAAGTSPTTIMAAGTYRAGATIGGTGATAIINGGDSAFVDTPPSGFVGY